MKKSRAIVAVVGVVAAMAAGGEARAIIIPIDDGREISYERIAPPSKPLEIVRPDPEFSVFDDELFATAGFANQVSSIGANEMGGSALLSVDLGGFEQGESRFFVRFGVSDPARFRLAGEIRSTADPNDEGAIDLPDNRLVRLGTSALTIYQSTNQDFEVAGFLEPGVAYELELWAEVDGLGNDFGRWEFTFAIVPEPGSAVVGLFLLGALVGLRGRCK